MATTRAAVDDLLGHPHRAASLSRKETKRIKEWKRRRDETLAMWARRIRRNAEWQKHVLFSIKPRKKRCLLQIEIGLAAGSRQQPLPVHPTWMSDTSCTWSVCHLARRMLGPSLSLSPEEWSAGAFVTSLSSSTLHSVSRTAVHLQTLRWLVIWRSLIK